ncbi:hypothetical protein PHISP_08797, partial [Aspergillus sp. HF37]
AGATGLAVRGLLQHGDAGAAADRGHADLHRLLPGKHVDAADHGAGADADGDRAWHRSDLVRHLLRAADRGRADHPAGRAEP